MAERILDTAVCWTDLQTKCLKIFGPSALFGPNKSISNVGEGKGNVARCCLIEPDWKNPIKPEKFITKICIIPKDSSGTKDTDYAPTTRKIHNVECTAYKLLMKYKNEDILVPHIYCTVPFTPENTEKGFIIMEYIENAITTHIWDNLGKDEVEQALKVIAALQAISFKFTKEEKKSLSYNPLYDIFSQIKKPNTDKSKDVLLGRGPVRAFIADTRLEPIMDEYLKLLPEFYDLDFMYGIGQQLNIPPVFVHGDAWSSNFLWKKENGKLRLLAVIDFQTAYMGMPGGDVCRIISTFLSAQDRADFWRTLIQFYHKSLTDMIHPQQIPFDLSQLEENIKRYFPLVRLVFAIAQCFEKDKGKLDEDERAKKKQLLLEKMEGIAGDSVFYHKRNQGLKDQPQSTNRSPIA